MDKVSSRHVSWIDLEQPTEEKIGDLVHRYSIHPLVAQELLTATYRPKLEDYDDHLYLVLHFPVCDKKTTATLSREIDFVIFPYTLITVHYEDIPHLDDFQQFLAGHEAVRERKFGRSSGQLLYQIIKQLFAASRDELRVLEKRIDAVQEKVFSGNERSALQEISGLRRDILNFQKALKPQETVLKSLAEHGKKFFGPDASPYFNDILGEYTQLWNIVEDLRATLNVIYETNVSLLSVSVNEAVRFLTAVSFILLPLQVVINLFGMNITNIPLAHHPNAFWILLALNGVVGIIILQWLRQKDWL
ncbi:MAG: magnesium transporter CorA family protein [Patescibacteria group bacterium]